VGLGKRNGKNILAFCNAADTSKRDNLTLRISFDEGKTWAQNLNVDKSEMGKKDFTAYSDLVPLSDHSIGVLYERDGYAAIVFTTISWHQ
jgi:sialidase-1